MLKGRTALVTGSTSGIGLGIAEALAKEGANVVLNGFGDEAEVAALRARLADSYRVTVKYDGADVSRADAIEAMMKAAIAEFGAVDVLVNNAGIQADRQDRVPFRDRELVDRRGVPLGTQFLNAKPDAGIDWPVRLLVQQDERGDVRAVYTDFIWIARRHGIKETHQQPFKTASGVIASITSSVTK